MVEIQDIEKAVVEARQENSLFVNKAALDAFAGTGRLAGREAKAGELVRALVGGLSQKYAPPFVFVYGRTGSGKSSIVKFVCASLPVTYRLVDLRQAHTLFGCASLILSELGVPYKSSEGIGAMLEKVAGAIESLAGDRLFVLVLDEFDSLFRESRGRSSDFLYRLLAAQEKLRAKGQLVTIVAVSNNVAASDEMDDRVRSRLGSSPEIFFSAYSKDEVAAMLEDRAKAALAEGSFGHEVIEYCAEQSSMEAGDARRAIDLMRVAAEIAGAEGGRAIEKKHVDAAIGRLQKERITSAFLSASFHLQMACLGLARVAFLAPEVEWYPTSIIYKQYCMMLMGAKPLGYRRMSDILGELENQGITVSKAVSGGKHGYGRHYRLTVPPDAVGACFPEYWEALQNDMWRYLNEIRENEYKAKYGEMQEFERTTCRIRAHHAREAWKSFVKL